MDAPQNDKQVNASAPKAPRSRILQKQEWSQNYHSAAIYGYVFVVLLICAALWHIFTPDRGYSALEKRTLTAFPQLSWQNLASAEWMQKVEKYASDQFPARDAMMKLKSDVSLRLGETESNGVYYGRDGSLMQAMTPWEPELLDKTVEAVTRFTERYTFRSSYFLLVPSAMVLYSENLPFFVDNQAETSYIEAFREKLPETLLAPDLLPILNETKQSGERVFYLTDHHWTTDAAYHVFTSVAPSFGWKESRMDFSVVSNHFLGALVSKSGYMPASSDSILAGYDRETSVRVARTNGEIQSSFYRPEALGTSDEYLFFLGDNEPMLTITTTADSDETLLVFKDSYANCFLPFLAASYKTIIVIDPRYYSEPVSSLFITGGYTDVLFLYSPHTLAYNEALSILLVDEAEE
ncbi:MAG: hypothetical protein J5496_01495 [Lachnospiraceae bacterium]|nr:hypothetical protein [Lachnospiraceae bacterium]